MLLCRRCGCRCDPADIVNGICDDCREEQWRMELLAEEVGRAKSERFEQIRFEVKNNVCIVRGSHLST